MSKHKDKETGKDTESEELVTVDEGIRPDTTAEVLAKLKPSFKPDGKVTAGNSSQITDGASAVLIMSEERASTLGLTPRARFTRLRIRRWHCVMLTGPIPTYRPGCWNGPSWRWKTSTWSRSMKLFASVVLAWEKDLHPDMDKVNVNGGAIALGHPLGCSGTKLMATLLNELERTGGRYGLQTMCEGGGLASATIIEQSGLIGRRSPVSWLDSSKSGSALPGIPKVWITLGRATSV